MLSFIELDNFIAKYITKRGKSLFYQDLIDHHSQLEKKIKGKSVLVIGGAGTIGSNYIKAILKFKIAKLVVVDINENGLTELVRDIRSSSGFYVPDDFITYPIDFGDAVFEKMMRGLGPFDIVANFAAHKHVRSEKDIFSIEAMIENNVFRSRKLMNLLLEFPPEHFFCVSTDKAANPVNIMGASKKLMEEMIMAYANKLPIKTARFANVAFSNGSLLLGFIDRLNKNQPWSCPLGIRRFFVSPQESGELCLLASILGESGDIFFPVLDDEKDMIPFDQIAIDLLKDLGFEADICNTEDEARQKANLLFHPEHSEGAQRKLTDSSQAQYDTIKKYPIYFFGSDTSGEKSYEEFYTENELIDNNSFLNLGIIKNARQRSIPEIDQICAQLALLFESSEISKDSIVKILKDYLPNFNHLETGKGLDSKM